MSASLPEPLPFEVGQYGDFDKRMVRNFYSAVADWEDVCSALGAWEAEHLTKDSRKEAQARHKRWLHQLLSWGRVVQRAAQEPEFPDHSLAAKVNARIRHLEDKLALWHGEMTQDEEEHILNAAFK